MFLGGTDSVDQQVWNAGLLYDAQLSVGTPVPRLAGRTAVSRKWVSGMDAAKEAEGQDGPSATARWSGADVRASCARRRTGQSGRAFLVTFLAIEKSDPPGGAEQGSSADS